MLLYARFTLGSRFNRFVRESNADFTRVSHTGLREKGGVCGMKGQWEKRGNTLGTSIRSDWGITKPQPSCRTTNKFVNLNQRM